MKNLLFLSFLSLISLSLFSQIDIEKCVLISKLDNKTYQIDTSIQNDIKVTDFIVSKLFPEIFSIDYNHTTIKANLDCINHTETITWIQHIYINRIIDLEHFIRENKFDSIKKNPISKFDRSPSEMKKILQIINKRTQEVSSYEFALYQHRDAKEKWIKYVYFDHANDFLSFLYNNDRDMTGASRFEVGTDKIKLRLFAKRNDDWYNLNSKSWYTYQTVFAGGEAYTPDLDSPLLISEESYNPYDRPFASFIYFGWSRHGIFRSGKSKYSIEWKIGTIGSLAPDKVQSAIHRDLTIGTRKPYGWDSQIASGGRVGINYNFNFEYLFDKNESYIPYTSLFGDLKVGTQNTSVGVGINFSNKDLKSRGALNIPLLKNNKIDFALNFKTELRYVIHNSMLEGYGVFKRTPDEDPSSPIDIHFLNGDQINRLLSISELSIGIDFKYLGFFYSFNIMSPEYEINNIPEENIPLNDSRWNHVGKLGILFKI
ncbi:hypothetical protein LPB136_05275 [Tenacibaculum todarodis]|uniref:Outer membrane protein beta-barrel domain-containing protein n=1 Tax=Tenacibaculum todarodis TaxID=1850252 RepID=A0A1L3JI65_9FLAO|nr:lipid A-modifier LpxR family protein [Tenacibaculum todarodis]APG64807.1 hypothetical protein LPB136_05275 [Tenacibaculum todarodis]